MKKSSNHLRHSNKLGKQKVMKTMETHIASRNYFGYLVEWNCNLQSRNKFLIILNVNLIQSSEKK